MPRQIKDLENYNFRPANFRDMLVVAKMAQIFGAQIPDMGVYKEMFINALREQGYDPGQGATFPWYPNASEEPSFRDWVGATFVRPTQAHLNAVLDADEPTLKAMQPLRSPSSAVGKAMLMATGQYVAKERKAREPKAPKPPKAPKAPKEPKAPKLDVDGNPVKRGRKPKATVESDENTSATPTATKTRATANVAAPSKTLNTTGLEEASSMTELCVKVLEQLEPKVAKAWAKHADSYDVTRSALIKVAYAQVIMNDEAKMAEFMSREDVTEAQANLPSVHWKVAIGSVDPTKENIALADASTMPTYEEVEAALNEFQATYTPGQKVPAHLKGTPVMSVISAYEWLKSRDSAVRPFYDAAFLTLITHKVVTDNGLMGTLAPYLATLTPDGTAMTSFMIDAAQAELTPATSNEEVDASNEEATAE